MAENTIIGLNLVSTDELVQELCNRHAAIIIVREDLKDEDSLYVSAKTPLGKKGKPEVGFDLLYATELLANGQLDLVAQYFKLWEDDSGDAQDNQETT